MSSIVEQIFLSLVILAYTTDTVLAEVKSPPYFVKQPSTKEILFNVDKYFEIPCEAKGIPAPNYFWTKNGKIFNWINERSRISQEAGEGTLIIDNAKSSDAGQYQCYAKNIWGTATSNSIFARRIELDSFRNVSIMRKEAIEGQPFSLTCKPPYGYPTPNVNWMLQGSFGKLISIASPRITADPTGTLWFSNITKSDASDDYTYACLVRSSYMKNEKIGAVVMLEVVKSESSVSSNDDQNTSTSGVPPVKQYTSKNEEIAVSNTKVRLFCIFGGTPLPTITWHKNGQQMTFNNKISLKEGGKIVEIQKSLPFDEGNYTCEANNGIGDALSHTISLKILVEPVFLQKPERVTLDEGETLEFHCQAIGNPTPEIIWTYNGKPLSEASPNPRWIVSSNSIVIEKLWENDTGNYGCNATNSVGYIYQDACVSVSATHIPFKNPNNVTVQVIDPTTLKITWKQMPKTEHNGPGFYYKIFWKTDSPNTDWEYINISEWQKGEYNVFNILPYEEYLVRVIAGNDLGESIQSPITVRGYYEQEVPLEAPKNLKLVKIISSTSAEISWNRVSGAALRGNFQKYEIEVWPKQDDQKRNVVKKSIKYKYMESTVINNMTRNTRHNVRISVFNIKYQGPWSEEVEIKMFEGETQVPSEATNESRTKNNTSDLATKGSGTRWIIVLLTILFLIVLFILIAVYLRNLNTRMGIYHVREIGIHYGRPDKTADTDTIDLSPVNLSE